MNEITADIYMLKNAIKECKKNIELYKEHIKEQDKHIDEYNFYIRDDDNDYDNESLKEGIKRFELHKETLNDTIEKEKSAIAEYKIMISTLEEKDARNNPSVSES